MSEVSQTKSDWPDQDLMALKASAKQVFGGLAGVEGIGIGKNGLRVYVRDNAVSSRIPPTYQGVPIECVVVGRIVAKSMAR